LSRRVSFRPEAEAQALETRDCYEGRRPGLGAVHAVRREHLHRMAIYFRFRSIAFWAAKTYWRARRTLVIWTLEPPCVVRNAIWASNAPASSTPYLQCHASWMIVDASLKKHCGPTVRDRWRSGRRPSRCSRRFAPQFLPGWEHSCLDPARCFIWGNRPIGIGRPAILGPASRMALSSVLLASP
jgi:hypothetical protein